MSFKNNVGSGPNINLIDFDSHVPASDVPTSTPHPSKQQVPDGISTRTSEHASLPPRSNNLNLQDLGSDIRKEGGNAASTDGKSAINDMAAMNRMNMEFQIATGIQAMNKSMVEAMAKTIKDAGAKVAQLAG
jgi:hypothetical protein